MSHGQRQVGRLLIAVAAIALAGPGCVDTELSRPEEEQGLMLCAVNAMRLFDSPNYGGKMLCVSGASKDLKNYCRISLGEACVATWENAVRSYKTASWGGQFRGVIHPDAGRPAECAFPFSTLETEPYVTECVKGARYLDLY